MMNMIILLTILQVYIIYIWNNLLHIVFFSVSLLPVANRSFIFWTKTKLSINAKGRVTKEMWYAAGKWGIAVINQKSNKDLRWLHPVLNLTSYLFEIWLSGFDVGLNYLQGLSYMSKFNIIKSKSITIVPLANYDLYL